MSRARRTVDDQTYCHFVTFSVYRRRRLLDHDHPKRIVLGVLNGGIDKHDARCVGFVVMPDHLHALVWLPRVRELSPFVQEWKRHSSLRIRQWYRQCANNYACNFDEGDKFWQPKYYSFSIYLRTKLEEKLAYMHLNPVRAGLVSKSIDYPWSSARWYELNQSVGVPIEWVD